MQVGNILYSIIINKRTRYDGLDKCVGELVRRKDSLLTVARTVSWVARVVSWAMVSLKFKQTQIFTNLDIVSKLWYHDGFMTVANNVELLYSYT